MLDHAAVTPIDVERGATWYRDLFDGLPTATLVSTRDGHVTHANDTACRLLKRSRLDIVDRPLASFIAPAYRRTFEAVLAKTPAASPGCEFAIWAAPRGAAPCECRAWVRRLATVGDDILVWTLASLLPTE